jgi:hypothetical protein
VNTRRATDLIWAGIGWGLLALLLGGRAFGHAVWAGVISAPAIAVVIGTTLQHRFEAATSWGRALLAFVSLYLGATLFAMATGIGSLLGLGAGNRRFPTALLEPLLGTWWGITLTGFFLVLWPLAYATHWWLEWRTTR